MTKECFSRNMVRICSFYESKIDWERRVKEFTASEFIFTYGRMLDYYGAPNSGMSLIYANGDDYAELKEWAELGNSDPKSYYSRESDGVYHDGDKTYPVVAPAMLRFKKYDFDWVVQNI